MGKDYLEGIIKQYEYYKLLGDKSFEQINDEAFFWQPNEESNSIAVIVKHLWGNMLSRWTDFLSTDGEKDWRDREGEFETNLQDADDLRQKWDAGWKVLLDAIRSL